MDRLATRRNILGDKALWGWVGYAGEAFAPLDGTYAGVDPLSLAYTTVEDSGAHPRSGAALANLFPLIAAALYEAGFAREAGPLTTWSN
jgi:hypothetical protein